MQQEYLTKDVFEVWAKNFDQRLAEALALRDRVDGHDADIAVLADRSERAERQAIQASRSSKGWASLISTLISAAIGALSHFGK